MFQTISHDPGRDGGADIGAEDDAYGLFNGHQAGVDHPNDHHRRYRAGLDDACYRQARSHTKESVIRRDADEFAHPLSGHGLHTIGHVFHAKQKQKVVVIGVGWKFRNKSERNI